MTTIRPVEIRMPKEINPMDLIVDPTKLETIEIDDDPRKISVAICVPAYGHVAATWVINFFRFVMYNYKHYNLHLFLHEQQPVSVSRNELVRMALEKKADYIFFMDADNIVPDLTITRLIQTMNEKNADLVTALYLTKDAPYYPVIREYRSDGFWKIENPGLGQKFEIAGCGLGSCLIRPDVFSKIDEPWFAFNHETWGRKDIVLSEDLYFCRKLMRKGLKMYCDTSILSGHLGGMVDVMEYMNYAPIRESTKQEREECLADLMAYLGKSLREIDIDMLTAKADFNAAWELNKNSNNNPATFWKESITHLYYSVLWHFSDRRKFDIELITALNRHRSKQPGFNTDDKKMTVLDFGCGIGQNAIMLARAGFDVTLADLDGKALDFAISRFKKHNLPYKLWPVEVKDYPSPEAKYDIILGLDVMEYIPLEEFRKVVPKLMQLKHKNSYVVLTHNRREKMSILPITAETNVSLVNLANCLPMEGNLNTEEYWNQKWCKSIQTPGMWDYAEKFEWITDLLEKHKGDRQEPYLIADLASGPGILLGHILKRMSDVKIDAVDFSESALEQLSIKYPMVQNIHADLRKENPLVGQKKYDAVLMTEFIEHMPNEDIDKILKDVQQIIKPTGIYVCSTPNSCMGNHICAEHLQDYNEKSFKELLDGYFSNLLINKVQSDGWEFLIAVCQTVKLK